MKIYSAASHVERVLLDEFLGLEVATQIEDLPGGEAKQAAHGKHTEVEHSRMCGLIGVSPLLLPCSHVREVIDDGL